MLFNKHYPCLDFLRSIAIILVMLVHFNERFYPLPANSFLHRLAAWGWNGVGLFFALSGFLIGGQLIESLQTRSFSFKKFYIKRFWRIFPPYYFSLLIVAILYFTGLADDNVIYPDGSATDIIKTLVYHTLYLQDYLRLPRLQVALYWSLAVEEQFYILAPLLLYMIWRYCRPYFPLILSGLIVIGISTRFMLYGPDLNWLLDIRFPFHTRFDSLLFGVLAAYLFIVYNERLKNLSAFTRWILFLSSFAAIGACLIFGGTGNGYFNTCWQFTLTGFGFSLLTLTITISSFDSYIHTYLKKFFSITARLSYTIYLYHLMLIFPLGHIIIKAHKYLGYNPGRVGFLLSFCLYFLCVLAASAIVYQFIDRPSMSYRKKILKRMEARMD